MRGHITKRGKSSWTIVLSLGRDPATGKRKRQWVSVKGSKKDAERRLAELLCQLDTGSYIPPIKLTFGEFLKQWLRDYAWPNMSPTTAQGYEHTINRHLITSLGAVGLVHLTPQHLQEYYSEKLSHGRLDGKGGLSARTVRGHHITIHSALQSAVKWGLLARNPADAVDPPRFKQKETKTFDEDGLNRFLGAARATPYYAFFYLALFTGMRRSELLALRWDDIDLHLSQITVVRSFHRLRDGRVIFKSPKTARGRRLVALPPSATLVLREHLEKQLGRYSTRGEILKGDDLIFTTPDGQLLLPDTITQAWIKLVRQVGLRGIRLHDARHSHASLMLKQGVHPKIVSERLGHANVSFTLDTYSHVLPGLQQAAARGFDEALLSDGASDSTEVSCT